MCQKLNAKSQKSEVKLRWNSKLMNGKETKSKYALKIFTIKS